ncbi:hypothetical protein CU097_005660 [Rhizopus azygosporus]|uniref:Xaa-Pro aminopeptidase P n=1 Tax=Rhizopus azygosporus TaxID=86630 RepID=A0A367JUE3_RHIAZ|nr:hypothetical protein CU097_005660 [Rhizopus azygosporus]
MLTFQRLYSTTLNARSKLSALRAAMSQLDAIIIPSEDAHQSEYTAQCDNRREWLSDFTGSAGCAVVTQSEALLFTDGRYFLQANKQLDSTQWKLMKQGIPGVPSWQDYVTKHLPVHASVGIDPSVINVAQAKQLEDNLAARGSRLIYTETNLVDQVRERVPERPHESIKRHPLEYAGKSARDKLQELRQALKGKCSVLSRLDEIAWLFNLRGSDIHCCPVFFSYCLITPDKAFLYVQKDVMEDKIRTELEQLGIEIRKYDDIVSDLLTFDHTMFSIDPDGTNMSILQALNRNSNQIDLEPSPVQLLKAIKNPAELKGLRDCHKWDAIALCRHFAWLSEKISKQEQVWEIEAAEHLNDMRRCHPLYVGPSFDTIAASGPNGAIIHYSPTRQDCSKIDPFELYLCDSGGHYLNGTTDVTRTYLFSGEPSLFQKRAFIRVLQAHIAIDQAIFPEGVTGYQLDSVARQPLWKDGLDFRHGVGHGVGAYLNVHEGPHGIGSRKAYDQVPLQAGMIVTNEPGYYKDRQFGIRIENVLHVQKSRFEHFLGFEHLTFLPLGSKMMDSQLLNSEEIDWINRYHSDCRNNIEPFLGDSKALAWLEKETEPI